MVSPCFSKEVKELWQSMLAEHATLLSLMSPLDPTPYKTLIKEFDECENLDAFLSVLQKLQEIQEREEQLLLPSEQKYKNYLSLLKHMQMEQEIVPRMLEGHCMITEEFKFIGEEICEHTALIRQILMDIPQKAGSELKCDVKLEDLVVNADQNALLSIYPLLRKLVIHELTESLLGWRRLMQLAKMGDPDIELGPLEEQLNDLETFVRNYKKEDSCQEPSLKCQAAHSDERV